MNRVLSVVIIAVIASFPAFLITSDSNASDDSPGWYLMSKESYSFMVLPNDHAFIEVYPDSIGTEMLLDRPLPTECADALEAVPEWMRIDLALKFHQLSRDDSVRFAQVILDAPDPNWSDEVAFVVAHSSVPALTDQYFFPELFHDNARLIYEADRSLDYVRLVEKGDHTTVAYISAGGSEVEVPRDIYYWYIVHPKLGDELPTYVDTD